jgi:hypothetical protein
VIINDNEPTTEAVYGTAIPDQPRAGNEKTSKNNGDNKIREKNTNNKPDKGNKGSDTRDDESPGKSNGKKNE